MRHLVLALALLLVPSLASAATVQVTQSGLIFSPDDITIQVGDTVEWIWADGSHTVTSGTGAADPNVGSLFDAPLNSSNTTFSYTFNSAGDFDYFCRPHEGFGMAGIVRVQAPQPVPTLSKWATLLLVLLISGTLWWRRRANA